ncbi:MAG: hypothetical protein LBK99_23335 [Opitutaceae bacterium]|jgi:hypothetical protein|nr:hypothetical protein [Opitutaceae bacterium]
MSEPVTLHENDLLTITAARGNSRLYNLWLLPEKTADDRERLSASGSGAASGFGSGN